MKTVGDSFCIKKFFIFTSTSQGNEGTTSTSRIIYTGHWCIKLIAINITIKEAMDLDVQVGLHNYTT